MADAVLGLEDLTGQIRPVGIVGHDELAAVGCDALVKGGPISLRLHLVLGRRSGGRQILEQGRDNQYILTWLLVAVHCDAVCSAHLVPRAVAVHQARVPRDEGVDVDAVAGRQHVAVVTRRRGRPLGAVARDILRCHIVHLRAVLEAVDELARVGIVQARIPEDEVGEVRVVLSRRVCTAAARDIARVVGVEGGLYVRGAVQSCPIGIPRDPGGCIVASRDVRDRGQEAHGRERVVCKRVPG